MALKMVLRVRLADKEEATVRPRACVVASGSSRFRGIMKKYFAKMFGAGTPFTEVNNLGGARRMLKSRFQRDDILDQIDEVLKDGAQKIILVNSATEGESEAESERILRQIGELVSGRFPGCPIIMLVIRNDGLLQVVP
ncbi:MAG TPA: SGNH/GDSL hydrolase family protein [Candidatus Paceibacterota bacterium]|nr:SGNH/GDSL hydrolase family protein [Candidatus Paceibacterota bacterium]